MDNKKELLAGSERMIAQLQDVLQKLDPTTYTHPIEVLEGHTLGQHFRHVIEFYQCMLNGCEAGPVDYSARKRDPGLETRPKLAYDALTHIQNRLSVLEADTSLQVRSDVSSKAGEKREVCLSSIGRELMYAFDHAVHHLAIIRIGLRSAFPHIQLDQEVGIAPATVRHRKAS